MQEIGFNAKIFPSRRHALPYSVEKFVEGGWVTMSRWQKSFDEERLQRHASALGGHVRMLRGAVQVREWLGGQEIGP